MDRVPDGGTTWRRNLYGFLRKRGVIVFDPCDKPIDIGVEDVEVRNRIQELKEIGNYDEIASYRDIRHVDLRSVDVTDYTIVNIDMGVHACGTYEEGFWANREKKPVLVHIEQGKKAAPNWLFWTFPHQHIFSTWDEIKLYLEYIDEHGPDDTKRWCLFDLAKSTLEAMLIAAEKDPKLHRMIMKYVATHSDQGQPYGS